MRSYSDWPKKFIYWETEYGLYISIPFTWELPKVRKFIKKVENVHVGGPAVDLMPDYFNDCENVVQNGGHVMGVMQMFNAKSTRTTTGCICKCEFCGVGNGKIEPGGLKELEDWPDLPIISDNNLLAASIGHFDRVMDRLEKHIDVDFNQGLDCRLLTEYHAFRFKRLKVKRRGIRLALDNMNRMGEWSKAYNYLRQQKIPKSRISSYALIGFDSDPVEAWERCNAIQSFGIDALPMWFHELDAMKVNTVTEKQQELGWNDFERRRIMQWFYHRKKLER